MTEMMTIEQIADAVGKAPRTVRGWASKTSAKMTEVLVKMTKARQEAKAAEFTYDETMEIIRTGSPKLAEFMEQNAKGVQSKNNEVTLGQPQPVAGQDMEDRIVKRTVQALLDLGIVRPANQIEAPKRLPLPGSSAPLTNRHSDTLFPVPMTEREELNNLITEKAHDWNFPREEVFKRLYTEINYRKQTNIQHGARKNGCKTVLDYLERKEWIVFAIGVLKEL